MFDVNILDSIGKEPQTTKKEPIKKDCDTYDRYIKQSFRTAFDFLEKHKHARTDEDFQALVADIPKSENPLVVGLISAVIDEIEREYETEKISNPF